MAEQTEQITDEPRRVTRLIRLKEVQHRVGLGRSTIYRWMSEGKFPKPVQLGSYTVAWAEDEVEDWILSRLERHQQQESRTVSANVQPCAQSSRLKPTQRKD